MNRAFPSLPIRAAVMLAVMVGLAAERSTAAEAGQRLSGQELGSTLAGMVVVGTRQHFTHHIVVWGFRSEGTLTVETSSWDPALPTQVGSGQWSVLGDTLCLTVLDSAFWVERQEDPMLFSLGHEGCYLVTRERDEFKLVEPEGDFFAWFMPLPAGAAITRDEIDKFEAKVQSAREGEYEKAWQRLKEALAERERFLAELQRKESRIVAAAHREAYARRRQLKASATAPREDGAPTRETEELRKRLAAAERRQAETEQRAAEARAREAEEKAQRRAELEAEARLKAEQARLAREEESRAQEQIASLQKQLEDIARRQGLQDTAVPRIEARVPERVEVGDEIRITGLVGDQGSPPRLKVNGQPAPVFRLRQGQKPIARHTLAFEIEIPTREAGTRQFLLEACDAAGNCVAERLALDVVVANRPDHSATNYALIIGNDEYEHLPDLKTAVADARAVAEVLTGRYAFERENVRLVLNADRKRIMGELSALRQRLKEEDRLFIYYAGHGQIDPSTEEGFWQPVDAVPDQDFTWIDNSGIRRYLRGMPAKHVLVVADSCFSGSLTRSGDGDARSKIPKDRFFVEIDSHVSRKMISSGGTEPVADSGSGGHSVFAYYLLKALRENDQPYIASFELFNRLARAVTNNSKQKPEYGTVADAGDEGAGDFTFILKPGG